MQGNPSQQTAGNGASGEVARIRNGIHSVKKSPLDPERIKKYRNRFYRVWGYIGIGIIAAVICWGASHITDALVVLVLGAILAFIYAPITNALERKLHVPRLLGTFIGLFVIVAIVLLLCGLILPPIVQQAVSFLQAVPTYADLISNMWDDLNATLGSEDSGAVQQLINSLLDSISSQAGQLGTDLGQRIASGVFSGVTSLVNGIVDTFMAIVLSFWLAKDFPGIESEISNIVGPSKGEDYRIITTVFSRSLSGYLKGLIINSAVTGCIAGIGFWILGIPYALLLGIITAILNIIPYIGPWIGGILAFLVGLSVGIWPALLSIVVTVVAQQFTDNIVSPKVMQTAVALHPALVIFAMIAGGSFGGIVGMIAAVPLTAAIKGTFVYYFEKRTGRQLVSKNGMFFKGEPFCDENGNPRPACDALGIDITADEGVPERLRKAMASSAAPQSEEPDKEDAHTKQ